MCSLQAPSRKLPSMHDPSARAAEPLGALLLGLLLPFSGCMSAQPAARVHSMQRGGLLACAGFVAWSHMATPPAPVQWAVRRHGRAGQCCRRGGCEALALVAWLPGAAVYAAVNGRREGCIRVQRRTCSVCMVPWGMGRGLTDAAAGRREAKCTGLLP